MSRPGVSHLPYESSFVPEILTEEHRIKFACHPGVSCFNACCKQADVMLAPYDVIRLKQKLGMTFIDEATYAEINNDDIASLKFGYRFLRQALFGEKTIALKEDALKKRAEERKDICKARHEAEMEYAQLNDPRYDPAVIGDEVMRDDMLKAQEAAARRETENKDKGK